MKLPMTLAGTSHTSAECSLESARPTVTVKVFDYPTIADMPSPEST